jgi:hypothetical protein
MSDEQSGNRGRLIVFKLLIAIGTAFAGAVVGGFVGLWIAGYYIFRAADGSHLPGCGNVGMDPGMVIGLVLGTAAGIWIVSRRH